MQYNFQSFLLNEIYNKNISFLIHKFSTIFFNYFDLIKWI